MATLFEKLGGQPAVDAAVEIFYRKVLSDPLLAPYFELIDMDAQIAKQKAFLTMAFGGPANYSGKDLRAGHAHLVKLGVGDAHFDAVVGHLAATLKELNVPDELIGEVAAIAASVRADVLNK
jgi:hemoglobin